MRCWLWWPNRGRDRCPQGTPLVSDPGTWQPTPSSPLLPRMVGLRVHGATYLGILGIQVQGRLPRYSTRLGRHVAVYLVPT